MYVRTYLSKILTYYYVLVITLKDQFLNKTLTPLFSGLFCVKSSFIHKFTGFGLENYVVFVYRSNK